MLELRFSIFGCSTTLWQWSNHSSSTAKNQTSNVWGKVLTGFCPTQTLHRAVHPNALCQSLGGIVIFSVRHNYVLMHVHRSHYFSRSQEVEHISARDFEVCVISDACVYNMVNVNRPLYELLESINPVPEPAVDASPFILCCIFIVQNGFVSGLSHQRTLWT